jgi:hypothetical protein
MINGKKFTLGRIGKGLLVVGLVTTGVLASGGARAGYKASTKNWEVKITGTATTGHFSGAVKLAGQSADNLQYIGCDTLWYGVTATNTATVVPNNYGDCYARDSAGNVRSCYLTVRGGQSLAVAGAVNATSILQVDFITVGGNAYCTNVSISNESTTP